MYNFIKYLKNATDTYQVSYISGDVKANNRATNNNDCHFSMFHKNDFVLSEK